MLVNSKLMGGRKSKTWFLFLKTTYSQTQIERPLIIEFGGNVNQTILIDGGGIFDNEERTSQVFILTTTGAVGEISVYIQIDDLDIIESITSFNTYVAYKSIDTAINYIDVSMFINLITLSVDRGTYQNLDITNLSKLVNLSPARTRMTFIDTSNNPLLETMNFQGSEIKTIDASNNLLLRTITATYSYDLANIDITNCTNLTYLALRDSKLDGKTLDVSHCPSLSYLYLHNSGLAYLILGNNNIINNQDWQRTHLNYVDLSGCSNLTTLHLDYAPMKQTTETIGSSSVLETYNGRSADTVSIDISSSSTLKYFKSIYSKTLTSFISGANNLAMETLLLYGYLNYPHGSPIRTPISSIDLSTMPNLVTLQMYGSELTSIDLSPCPLLTDVNLKWCFFSDLEIDSILNQLDLNNALNGTLTIDNIRTASSDTSYNNLISKGWTVNEVEPFV